MTAYQSTSEDEPLANSLRCVVIFLVLGFSSFILIILFFLIASQQMDLSSTAVLHETLENPMDGGAWQVHGGYKESDTTE